MICLFDCSFLSGPTAWDSPRLAFDLQRQADEIDRPYRWALSDRNFRATGTSLYWGYFPGMETYSGWFSHDVGDQ